MKSGYVSTTRATMGACLAFGLGGCVPANLQKFTLADLNTAVTDANNNGDTVAANCYNEVIKVLPKLSAPPAGSEVGLASAVQRLRDVDLLLDPNSSTGKEFDQQCGPFEVSVGKTLLRLGLKP
jgi:hypothetical protein